MDLSNIDYRYCHENITLPMRQTKSRFTELSYDLEHPAKGLDGENIVRDAVKNSMYENYSTGNFFHRLFWARSMPGMKWQVSGERKSTRLDT